MTDTGLLYRCLRRGHEFTADQAASYTDYTTEDYLGAIETGFSVYLSCPCCGDDELELVHSFEYDRGVDYAIHEMNVD